MEKWLSHNTRPILYNGEEYIAYHGGEGDLYRYEIGRASSQRAIEDLIDAYNYGNDAYQRSFSDYYLE